MATKDSKKIDVLLRRIDDQKKYMWCLEGMRIIPIVKTEGKPVRDCGIANVDYIAQSDKVVITFMDGRKFCYKADKPDFSKGGRVNPNRVK